MAIPRGVMPLEECPSDPNLEAVDKADVNNADLFQQSKRQITGYKSSFCRQCRNLMEIVAAIERAPAIASLDVMIKTKASFKMAVEKLLYCYSVLKILCMGDAKALTKYKDKFGSADRELATLHTMAVICVTSLQDRHEEEQPDPRKVAATEAATPSANTPAAAAPNDPVLKWMKPVSQPSPKTISRKHIDCADWEEQMDNFFEAKSIVKWPNC